MISGVWPEKEAVYPMIFVAQQSTEEIYCMIDGSILDLKTPVQ